MDRGQSSTDIVLTAVEANNDAPNSAALALCLAQFCIKDPCATCQSWLSSAGGAAWPWCSEPVLAIFRASRDWMVLFPTRGS
jgi:hypothetical protein